MRTHSESLSRDDINAQAQLTETKAKLTAGTIKLRNANSQLVVALKTLQEVAVKSEEADLKAGQEFAELRKLTAEFAQKIGVDLESAKADLVGSGTALRDEVQE